MIALFLSVFAALFSVVNPLGAMPVFIALTKEMTDKERRATAIRTSIYFVIILLLFFFTGAFIISFFGISLDAMRIAGGFIIFLSGHSLLRGDMAKSRTVDKKVQQEAMEKDDISLTPMAIPMLSGPGSISLLIGVFAGLGHWSEYLVVSGTVIALGAVTGFILFVAPYLFKVIGRGGLNAISRIMGFLVMAIGVQFVINGISGIIQLLG